MFITTKYYLCTSRERMELKSHDLCDSTMVEILLVKMMAAGPNGFDSLSGSW